MREKMLQMIKPNRSCELRSDWRRGFSLIELLVALTIFSIIVALIVSARIRQERSEVSQQQAVEMQQTVRAAMMLMAKDFRMAGFDPDDNTNAGITTAGDGSTGTNLTLTYVASDNGINDDGDGTVDEDDELRTVSYQLSDHKGDGDLDLMVEKNGGGYQLLAENIASLTFDYLNAEGNSTTDLADIRAITVTLTATVDNRDLNRLGTNNTRSLSSTVKCRNLGI